RADRAHAGPDPDHEHVHAGHEHDHQAAGRGQYRGRAQAGLIARKPQHETPPVARPGAFCLFAIEAYPRDAMWKIALLLLPLLGGCGQEDLQAPPPADWGRSPYFGSVKVAVYAPDGREMTELGDFGTASARFQNLDDARA